MSYAVIAFAIIVAIICLCAGGAYWLYLRRVMPRPDLGGFIDNRSVEQRLRDGGAL